MGYCHLRQAIRVFRLGRMAEVRVLGEPLDRPTNFKPDWVAASEQRPVVVTALFDLEVAQWVQESRPFSVVSEENSAEGLRLTLRVRDERDIFQWLLSWGRHVRIISPESLVSLVQDEIEQMAEKY